MFLNKITFALIVVICLLLLFNCTKEVKDRYAKFKINDVSKTFEFIDSTSSNHSFFGPNSVNFGVTGYLDSNALIEWTSKDNKDYQAYELKKGKIDLHVRSDFYNGEIIFITFTPKGCTKGELIIKTRIN